MGEAAFDGKVHSKVRRVGPCDDHRVVVRQLHVSMPD